MNIQSNTPGRLLDLKELLSVPYVESYSGYDISSDGRQAAFSWNRTGQMEIYLLDLQPAQGLPGVDGQRNWRQLTNGPGAKICPRFSPDGDVLLYLVDMDGSEAFDLYACNLRDESDLKMADKEHPADREHPGEHF